MPEGVVDRLEVVDIDEQGHNLSLAASASCEHLLHAIQDQRPVRQAGERVVGGKEPKLLLAARELFVRSLALGVKALGYPHQAELQSQLQHVQGLRERLLRSVQLHGALAQHLGHRVAPPQAALGQLVQRRRAVSSELAVDDPGFPAGLDGRLDTLARQPPAHRDRGASVDSLKAVLHNGVHVVSLPSRARGRQVKHVFGPRLQRLAERMHILPQIRQRRGGRRRMHCHARRCLLSGHQGVYRRWAIAPLGDHFLCKEALLGDAP